MGNFLVSTTLELEIMIVKCFIRLINQSVLFKSSVDRLL